MGSGVGTLFIGHVFGEDNSENAKKRNIRCDRLDR